jgi:hypothetical protein
VILSSCCSFVHVVRECKCSKRRPGKPGQCIRCGRFGWAVQITQPCCTRLYLAATAAATTPLSEVIVCCLTTVHAQVLNSYFAHDSISWSVTATQRRYRQLTSNDNTSVNTAIDIHRPQDASCTPRKAVDDPPKSLMESKNPPWLSANYR